MKKKKREFNEADALRLALDTDVDLDWAHMLDERDDELSDALHARSLDLVELSERAARLVKGRLVMSKYTADEIWEIAIEPDVDLELDRVMKMTDAEVRASLLSRGYDLQALEAQAKQLLGLPRRRRSRRGFIAAGMALLAAIGPTVAVVLTDFGPAIPILVATAGSAPPASSADTLRQAAFAACKATEWKACIEKLDEARRLDPDGDERNDVKAARQEAASHLEGDPR